MRRLRPAEMLLQKLGVTEPDEIDVEAIAWYCGVTVTSRPLDGCEAQIIGHGNRAVIIIDEASRPRRQRFSVGHELGHWHHHRGHSSVCRSDEIGNRVRGPTDPERVADGFAADLLLPGYLFRPLANKLSRVTMDAVQELADTFDTSLTATAIRVVEMGPAPAMVICHSHKGRKWFTPGPDVPNRWFPCKDLDAESFAFEVLFGSEQKSRCALIGADAWFDHRDAAKFELYEQSVRIGEEEILTLLVFKDEDMLLDFA